LPGELRARGYDLNATGDGERILPTAQSGIALALIGRMEPVTSGSTRAAARVVAHAGICKVKRCTF
jgi:hypothetical protein